MLARWKRIGKKILFPSVVVVLICVVITVVLLIDIFAFDHQNCQLAYLAYLFSAYTLVIACIWIAKRAGRMKAELENAIQRIPTLNRYLTDTAFRTQVSLYMALGINILYAAMKMLSGFYYHSVWFGTLAVYYAMLALMRFLLLRKAAWQMPGSNPVLEWKKYRLCGYLLLVLNIALSGVVILVIRKDEGFQYAGYLIYVMAMYTFYTMITAIVNVIKYRKHNSPVLSAAKAINLAAALVSMLSLETAMLAQFQEEDRSEEFRQIMTGTTGAAVCLIVLGMAFYMILRATDQLKKLTGNKKQN